tara:strand:- start:555 stop:986 length:432 start_codon:yes stop_codon:yes gene_type:complete
MKCFFLTAMMLILSACAHRYHYAGANFESTGSICADGIIVNMDAASCENIYIGHNTFYDFIKVRCVLAEEDNNWTSRSFYILNPRSTLPSSFDDEDYYKWACGDNTVVAYYYDGPEDDHHIRLDKEKGTQITDDFLTPIDLRW